MFTFVIPCHRDYFRLRTTLPQVQEALRSYPIKQVLICHNGPPLTQVQIDEINQWTFPGVEIIHTDRHGLGAGYRLGILSATQPWVVLSHSDLPFGFSDLQGFQQLTGEKDFVLGSKDHPRSSARNRKPIRLLATFGFKWIRKIFLGLSSPGDSQGTLIIKTSVAKDIIPACQRDNYLISLELSTVHLLRGGKVREVPVTLEPEIYPTNIRIFHDSWKMFLGILSLCWHHRVKREYRRPVLKS